jgi:hypothetical protein
MNKVTSFLFSLDLRKFAWVKRQPIRKGNLIAHTSVGLSYILPPFQSKSHVLGNPWA